MAGHSKHAGLANTSAPSLAAAAGFSVSAGLVSEAAPPGPVAVPHRYWRINVTAAQAVGWVAISEIQLYSTINGSNIATGGTASASTEYDASWAASKAFDGSLETQQTTNGWNSSANPTQWIKYDFGAGNPKAVVSVGMHARGIGATDQMPKTFDVQWSDDDTNWTTEWTVTNTPTFLPFEFRRFDNPAFSAAGYSGSPYGAHKYWRLYTQRSQNNGSSADIAELEFLATPGGTDQATGGSTTSGGGTPSLAFDDNNGTDWANPTNVFNWIRYDFASDVAVGAVSVRASATNYTLNAPKSFAVQFADSTSGPWTTAFSVVDAPAWTASERRVYTDPRYV